MLLAGSLSEALLLLRHHDTSEYGPGLKKLVEDARKERLFGRDTLRHLDTLVEYRDSIHPRAEKRNQTFRNEVRMITAITGLSLLCAELQDTGIRYQV